MQKRYHVLILALVSASASVTTHAEFATIYNLGTLGGTESLGYAINDSGQVTGISYTVGSSRFHAFLYSGTPGSGAAMVDLGTLGGYESDGFAINSEGQVAGISDTGAALHAFRYTGTPGGGGAMSDLGTLGGTYSAAYAINASGQVAGHSYTAGNAADHAFRYTDIPGSGGVMEDLGSLGGYSTDSYAINDIGQVAGSSRTAGNALHAFLYTGSPGSGGMIDLGTLGGLESFARGVNASGQVAGYSKTSRSGVVHAFLYTGTPGSGGGMADLGTLGGRDSAGWAINSFGQVAGFSFTAGDATHAFLYTGKPGMDGHMIDLDAWLDDNNPTEGAKWTLHEARGLSDNGLITGYGTYNDGPGGLSDGTRAFLLDTSGALGNRVKRATLDQLPKKTPGARDLILVSHGLNSNADGWVTDLAKHIADKASSTWDVWAYDWRNNATCSDFNVAFDPELCLVKAMGEGEALGAALRGYGYEHVHFIAHSLGANMIDHATGALKFGARVQVYNTFLDAWTPTSDSLLIGSSADFAEQYVNTDDLLGTNNILPEVANIDITSLDPFPAGIPDLPTMGNISKHNWVHDWYDQTVQNSATYAPLGFALSLEYSGTPPTNTAQLSLGSHIVVVPEPGEAMLILMLLLPRWRPRAARRATAR